MLETDEEDRPNRIVRAINKKEVDVQRRIVMSITTVEKIEEARKDLDMTAEEHAKFQELKSLAVATGVITLAEGMSMYDILGPTLDIFNKQSAAVKFVLIGFFKELIEKGV